MEIGSVLELDKWELYEVSNKEKMFWLPFMKDNKNYRTVFYQSGRNAIEALLSFLQKERGIRKLLLPDYMCDTVQDAGVRSGICVNTYAIDEEYDFSIDEIEKKVDNETCLFVAHYFGKKMKTNLCEYIMDLKKKGIILIEDVTLSLFSVDDGVGVGFGNYILGSIRKWLPVPDGGFLTTQSEKLPKQLQGTCVSKYVDFYMLVQTMKKEYIQGNCEDSSLKKIYMKYYELSIDELFSDYTLYPMSEWTTNYLQNYDIKALIEKRTRNYDYLYNKLSQIDGLKMKVHRKEGYLPFGMILQTENRDELLQYLISNNVYCNVHWRLQPSKKNESVSFLAQHSITIPCDQRYGEQEMDYIVSVLERWYEK